MENWRKLPRHCHWILLLNKSSVYWNSPFHKGCILKVLAKWQTADCAQTADCRPHSVPPKGLVLSVIHIFGRVSAVLGLVPIPVIPLEVILAALLLDVQHYEEQLGLLSISVGTMWLVVEPHQFIRRVMPASAAQLDALSDWRPGGREFNPHRDRQHYFVEIDHEIFSMVILSLPLIQEGQLSVSGERMCTVLVNRLEN